MVTAAPPQILEYRDYRRFIGDSYHFKKSLRAGFSFRRFSQMVGLRSPNYLQLVIQGKRNLSQEMAGKVAKTLGLVGSERRYFVALVGLENSSSEEQKLEAQNEILRSIKNLVAKEIPKTKMQVLTEWYHLVVRELIVLHDFEPSGTWISDRMRGLISPEAAERSLHYLLRTGFVKLEGGRHIQAEPVVDTGNAFDEIVGLKYHSNTLEAWAKLIPETEKSLREFGVLNIPIATAKIPELKDRMRKFQDEIIGWLQDEKEPDRIVQLGTYLLPTTKSSIKS